VHHYIGVILGAIVTYLLLLLFQDGRIISDQTTGFTVAVVIGAIVAAFWPWAIGFWLVRRHRSRQEERVQAEVARQVAEQTQPPGPR
jgi:hypothetical protein